MNRAAVIMSVYANDKLEYLEVALDSLYAQTKKVDIFIQQDGKVPHEIESYLDQELQDGKIAYLGKREENRGLAFSLNELLEIVLPKYHYIARMDADDISMPSRIKEQFEFIEKYSDIDVVGSFIEEFGNDIDYRKSVNYPIVHKEMFDFFKKRVPLAHVSSFFRKSFFEKAGLYPISSPTNEDTLLWMNGFQKGCRFANIPEVLVRVRVSSDFFSRRAGWAKARSDFGDRIKVIQTLGYNFDAYAYAVGMFLVNISPAFVKKNLYKILR